MGLLNFLFNSSKQQSEDKARDEKEKQFDVLKYDGVRALHSGQVNYAVDCFRHALAIKDDMETMDYFSLALVRSGELQEAMEVLEKLADNAPANALLYQRLAKVAFMMEDYDKMHALCEKALAMGCKDATILCLKGNAQVAKGDVVMAIASFSKAIALEPTNRDAYLMRAQTLLRMGDCQGADADLKVLLAQHAEDEDALLLKARVAHAQGKDDEAILYYNKVEAINPFCVEVFKERGSIRYAMGDKEGAGEDARTLLSISPESIGDVTGQYSAEGQEGIQQVLEKCYKANNPYGF